MALRNCEYCGEEYYTAESPAWSYCRDCYEKEQEEE
jgi:hypothetical protein